MVAKQRYTIGIAFFLCFLIPGATAQTTKGSYFMTSSHTRHYLNPALTPNNGYIGIPVLGSVYADVTTNTFTVDNFIFLKEAPGSSAKAMTFMHKDVKPEEFLANISDHNYLSVATGTDILSMGFRGKRNYWNFHLGARVLADVDIPRSLFELLKVGFADQDAEATRYDLSGLNISAQAYVEAGLAYSRSFLGERLIVGVRPKLLLGVGEMNMNVDQMEVSAGENFWEIKTRASLQTAAPGIQPEYDNEFENLSGFDFKWQGVPGIGAGVDVGASFRVFDLGVAGKLTASAALNNIGFIKWSGKNSYYARTAETSVIIRPNDYSVHQNGTSSIEDVLDDAVEDLERGMDFFTDPNKEGQAHTSHLNRNINLGVEYALFRDKLSFGVLYSSDKREQYSTGQCIVSANYRPCSWFATSASYALFTEKASNNVGLAIHVSPRLGPALFIASDCAIAKLAKQGIPLRGHNMNVQVGIAFNTGGGK
ncbi:MAG: DUF5723 family protein [Odoribacteraceae bacterium]|jgi:hypothetical protein|nr:DUF5723 family protein [Odoribacteraceae bacterium]